MRRYIVPLVTMLVCGVVLFLDSAPVHACGQAVINGVYVPLDEAECAARAAAQAEAAANQAIIDDLAAQGLTEGVDPMGLQMAVEQGGVEEALAFAETVQAAQAEAAANPGETVNWSYEGENWAMGSSFTEAIQVEAIITAPPTTEVPPEVIPEVLPEVPPEVLPFQVLPEEFEVTTFEVPPEVPDATWESSAEEVAAHNDRYADNALGVVNGVYLRYTDEEQAELEARRAEAAREQETRDAALAAAEDLAVEYPGRQVCAGWEVDGRTGQECATAVVPTTTIAAISASPPPTTVAPIEDDLSTDAEDVQDYSGMSLDDLQAASPCGGLAVVNGQYLPVGETECFEQELRQWESETEMEAQAAADAAARENPGVQQCASWTAGDRSGQACSIETRLAPGEGFLTHQAPDPEGTPIVDGEPVPCGTADWDNPLCYEDGVVPPKGGSVYRPGGDVVVPTEPPPDFLPQGYQGIDIEGNPIETAEDAPDICGTTDWENPACYEGGVLPVNRYAWNPNPTAPPTTTTTTPPTTTTAPPTTTTTTAPPFMPPMEAPPFMSPMEAGLLEPDVPMEAPPEPLFEMPAFVPPPLPPLLLVEVDLAAINARNSVWGVQQRNAIGDLMIDSATPMETPLVEVDLATINARNSVWGVQQRNAFRLG